MNCQLPSASVNMSGVVFEKACIERPRFRSQMLRHRRRGRPLVVWRDTLRPSGLGRNRRMQLSIRRLQTRRGLTDVQAEVEYELEVYLRTGLKSAVDLA